MLLEDVVKVINSIIKAPPGPKPEHYGEDVDWDDERHHWVLPDSEGIQQESSVRSYGDDELLQIGGQMGSAPGGLFASEEGQHYIKFPGESRARVEALSAKLYEAAGVSVPNISLIDFKGETAIKSDWIDNLARMSYQDMSNRKDVRRGFVVDAWLANWDVAGNSQDNIADDNGRSVRLDLGGALLFRAQGKPKKLADDVPELETMRDPDIARAAAVFGNLSDDELNMGARLVAKVSDEDIDRLLEESGLPDGPIDQYPGPDNIREFLSDKLKKRRDYIVDRFITPKRPGYSTGQQGKEGWIQERNRSMSLKPEEQFSYLDLNSVENTVEGVSLVKYMLGDLWDLNKNMRDKDLSHEDMDTVYNISSFMKPIKNPYTVYRGIRNKLLNDVGELVKPGDVVIMDGFVSTSRDPSVAVDFAGYDDPRIHKTFIEIKPTSNSYAITLDNKPLTLPPEYETLFGPGQKLRIESIEVDKAVYDGDLRKMANSYIVATLEPSVETNNSIQKAPPGPPPRPGLEWKEETHRWVCGIDGCEDEHDHSEKDTDVDNELSSAGISEFDFDPVVGSNISRRFKPKEAPSYRNMKDHVALREYTKNSYDLINDYLRGIRDDVPDKVIKYIDDISSLMKPIEQPQTLYRGMEEYISDIPLKAGEIHKLASFTSTSRSPDSGLHFTRPDDFDEPEKQEGLLEFGDWLEIQNIHWEDSGWTPPTPPDDIDDENEDEYYEWLDEIEREAEADWSQNYMNEYDKYADKWRENQAIRDSYIGVMFEIRTRPDTMAITLSNEDTHHTEDETLLGLNQRVLIEEVYENIDMKSYDGDYKVSQYVVVSLLSNKKKESSDYDAYSLKSLVKAPPGPPPRPGLDWKEETHRWIRPGTESGLQSVSEGELSGEDWEKAWYNARERAGEFNPEEAPTFIPWEMSEEISYYMDSGYLSINYALRNDTVEELDEMDSGALYEIASFMDELQEPQILYRGLRDISEEELNSFKVGEEHAVDAFMSTSRNPEVAAKFPYYSSNPERNSVFIEIHTLPETYGITLDSGEDETILSNGQYLHIVTVENDRPVWFSNQEFRVSKYVVGVVGPKDLMLAKSLQQNPISFIMKAPPGPPPRPGLDWKEETSRWVCPVEGCEERHNYHDDKELFGPSETENGLRSLRSGFGWSEIYGGLSKFDASAAPSYMSNEEVEQKQGVRDYIDAGFEAKYEPVNRFLRNLPNWNVNEYTRRPYKINKEQVLDIIADMNESMKPIGQSQITYRGLIESLEHKDGTSIEVGDVLDVDAFMSTSRSPGVASSFTHNMFLEIYSTPEARAITLDNSLNEEHETIYGAGQKLRINSVEYSKKVGGKLTTFVSCTIWEESELKKSLDKAPPGPPPREGLKWKEETHRWIRPDEEENLPGRRPKEEDEGKQVKPNYESLVKNWGKLLDEISKLNENAIYSGYQEYDIIRNSSAALSDYVMSASLEVNNYEEHSFPDQKQKLNEGMYYLNKADDVFEDAVKKLGSDHAMSKRYFIPMRRSIRRRHKALREIHREKLQFEWDNDVEFSLKGEFDYMKELFTFDQQMMQNHYDEADGYFKSATIAYKEGDKELAGDYLDSANYKFMELASLLTNRARKKDSLQGNFEVSRIKDSRNRLNFSIRRRIMKNEVEGLGRPEFSPMLDSKGKRLKVSNSIDIPIHSWEKEVLLSNRTYSQNIPYREKDINSTTASMIIQTGARKIMRKLVPKLQKRFQRSIQKVDVSTYNSDSWEKVVRGAFGESLPNGLTYSSICGFCGEQGIHVPDKVRDYDIIHEMGHHVDIFDVINEKASFEMNQLYRRKKEEFGDGGINDVVMRPYTGKNRREFFADNFAYYLVDPKSLFYKDPEAYMILNRNMFQ